MLLAVMILPKNLRIGGELHPGAVWLIRGNHLALFQQDTLVEKNLFALSLAVAHHEEVRRESIHRLDSYPVQTY